MSCSLSHDTNYLLFKTLFVKVHDRRSRFFQTRTFKKTRSRVDNKKKKKVKRRKRVNPDLDLQQ